MITIPDRPDFKNLLTRDSFLVLHRSAKPAFSNLASTGDASDRLFFEAWQHIGTLLVTRWDARAIHEARCCAWEMRLYLRMENWKQGIRRRREEMQEAAEYVEILTYFLSRQPRLPWWAWWRFVADDLRHYWRTVK